MTIRERTEAMEDTILSSVAALAKNSLGRSRFEEQDPIRTVFQRDRDRIIHCNAFRRLMHKTQVFLAPQGDHYRTRLTHTLEVSQIAKTIVRALRLNEDLTEAIALGHDLGHTPFGHAGERVLNMICPHGFIHSEQSVRVVDCLEKDGKGLNLTQEVKNGIACHTKGKANTLEGQAVKLADKIAYINHDIEDAIRAGVISEKDLPWDSQYVLGRTKSQRITTMVTSIIENSNDEIQASDQVMKAHLGLRDFMFSNVYIDSIAKEEEHKAEGIVETLYQYFYKHVQKLPVFYQDIAQNIDKDRAVCDYIAGMTDGFAINTYKEIFIPKPWVVS